MTHDDVQAITALVHEYAFRLDSGDIDGVVALFEHADLGAIGRTDRVRGSAGARTYYDPVIIYGDGTPRTMHLISNVTIATEGESATAQSYFTVLQSVDDRPFAPIVSGTYHDRFTRVDGRWRFAERLFDPSLVGDLSFHLRFDFGLEDDR